MKVIFINTKSSEGDLYAYGEKLLKDIQKKYKVVMYTDAKPDFSNVPELFDEEEKLLMINGFAFKSYFRELTKALPKFKNVKYILSPYSAYEGLDIALLKKMKIKYRNNGGANAKSVAQYATTVMFMLLSRFPILAEGKSAPAGSVLGEELGAKTAGIIGMGNVGEELLKNLNGLGIKTVYYNRTPKSVSAKKVSIAEVFKQDLVFITIATNPETYSFPKAKELSSYRKVRL